MVSGPALGKEMQPASESGTVAAVPDYLAADEALAVAEVGLQIFEGG